MVRPGGGDPGRRGRRLPCYRSPAAPTSAGDARPRGRCLRPRPDPHGERGWWGAMVTATSTHHQRLGQATRPSATRTRRPLPTSTPGKAVTPTQNTPTTNTLTLDPPSGPPLGGSIGAPALHEHDSTAADFRRAAARSLPVNSRISTGVWPRCLMSGGVYPKRTFLAPDLTRQLPDSLPDNYRGLRGVSGAHGHVTKMSSPCGLLITAA